MANINLEKYGITGVTEIVHNPSYEVLFAEETKADLSYTGDAILFQINVCHLLLTSFFKNIVYKLVASGSFSETIA